MIKTNGLLHIGLPVVSVSDAVQWFSDNMGFTLAYETDYLDHGVPEKVAFIQKDDVMYELYEYMADPKRASVLNSGRKIDHIAFRVDDVDKAYEEAQRLNLKVIKPLTDLPFWKNGCRFFTVSTPNGDFVEFMQIF